MLYPFRQIFYLFKSKMGMFAYRAGVLPSPFVLVFVIWISMLCASIFMYFEMTLAISVFIISIISGEQFTRSDINRIFNRSFAISLELFLLKMFVKPIVTPPFWLWRKRCP